MNGSQQLKPASREEIERALFYIPATLPESDWWQIGAALKNEGIDFSVFDSWSSGHPSYNPKETRQKWQHLKPSRFSFGTIQHHAKQYGYEFKNDTDIDYESIAKRKAEQQAKIAQHEKESLEKAKKVAMESAKTWATAKNADDSHGYLVKKQVQSYGLKKDSRGNLLIPFFNANYEVVALQTITPQGEKFFPENGKLSGCFFVIGDVFPDCEIYITEGYATGATIHQLTECPVYIAFFEGNLSAVSQFVRSQYEGRTIIVCADNDHVYKNGDYRPPEKNTGVVSASKAANLINAQIRIPHCSGTDFNDCFTELGRDATMSQLFNIEKIETPDFFNPANEGQEVDFNDTVISNVQNNPFQFQDSPDYLVKNFVMCHGSNLCWDIETKRFMKIEHLSLSAPMSFTMWKGMPGRKIIDIDKVVFDPACKQPNVINMFSGIKLKPKKGNTEPILNHLLELCNGDYQSYDWILKWIAYPLQNVGSKMATSIVMHGIEGTGKNIFWDCVKAIYGRYGVQIGQSQIESEFNAWLSCKLFIIANEVVSNRERRHIKGKIKQLITESPLPINQKNMPLRDEDIYANFVFLSNESQPIDTDSSDRRFMVIEARQEQTEQYFQSLTKSIDLSAFYHYLQNLDLGGFNRYTKPIINADKKELLRLNSSNQDRFIVDWVAGETDYPLQTIPAGMLYGAYQCWCAENGEKWFATSTAFGKSIINAGIVKDRCSSFGTSKKITVYFINEPVKTVIHHHDFNEFQQILNEKSARFNLKI